LLIIDQNKVNWKSINQYSLFVNLRNEIDFWKLRKHFMTTLILPENWLLFCLLF
jgi:hypothetical protein